MAAKMSGKLPVLMYHAVVNDLGQCDGADPHYAVLRHQFSLHLKALHSAGLRASSIAGVRAGAAAANAVAMTFDDGHASNRDAAEALAAHSFTADFLVNPSTVGKPNHLSWADLRAMSDAGMSIQSHGYHHRYLDELEPSEVVAELVDSKREIEDRIGRAVTVFGPPGGRTSVGLAEAAAGAGYGALCTSRVGLWCLREGTWRIPRLAVLNSTSQSRFVRWIKQDLIAMAAQQTRYQALSATKQLLGNERYEQLRRRLLGAVGTQKETHD
jgi:peptidoglycan/xylan/chitin deacetylase (PgdA/CDA1 family)